MERNQTICAKIQWHSCKNHKNINISFQIKGPKAKGNLVLQICFHLKHCYLLMALILIQILMLHMQYHNHYKKLNPSSSKSWMVYHVTWRDTWCKWCSRSFRCFHWWLCWWGYGGSCWTCRSTSGSISNGC